MKTDLIKPMPTREEKIEEMRRINTLTERIYAKAYIDSGCKTIEEFNKTLKPGAGKGLEPKPWCGCHNRFPCPVDVEYDRLMSRGL